MLAKRYHVSLDAMMNANPDLDPYNLKVGMVICIPKSSSASNMNPESRNNNMSGPGNNNRNMGGNCTNGTTYQTQRGDTLARILDRFEITFAALQNSNPQVDFEGSLENTTLCIPAEDPYRTCPMTEAYFVKPGDTLDSISRKFLIVPDSLLMVNLMLTTDDFSVVGTKICIPR